MDKTVLNRSVEFFDTQFLRQRAQGEYALNPFETAILPFLNGRMLDLGCGLGNLAIAAAQRGCTVTALDASPAAIEDLQKRAAASGLPVEARRADLGHYETDRTYDCVVAIGLLMFFPRELAQRGLRRIQAAVAAAGIAAVNVLIEGTTYMDMFDRSGYYLFIENELQDAFADWDSEYLKIEKFPAPHGATKQFCTIVARRPENA